MSDARNRSRRTRYVFATIGPIDVAAMFAALTANSTAARRHGMAVKGTAIATRTLLLFALLGEPLLPHLGISLAALRTAGGVLLLLIGIDMMFARTSRVISTTLVRNHAGAGN